jgi:hypothetical protein
MADSLESKLDAVLKAIEALAARTRAFENLALRVVTSLGAEIPQPTQHVAVEGPIPLPSQRNNCSNQNLDGVSVKYRDQGSASQRSLTIHNQSFKDLSIKFNSLLSFNPSAIQLSKF